MTILNKEKIMEVARAFIDEGRYDKAIHEYEKILLADPSDMRVKLRIAELYTKRKQINEAIRIYREVADSYAAEGFYLKAVTVHKNILRLNPSLSDTNEQLALLYEKMGLIGDAIRQYDILASSLDLRGQADRVIEIRSRIVKLAPKDGACRIKLAETFQREGRMDEAIDQYEEYARQIEESDGDKSKLADLFEKILAHRPDKHDMMRKLIRIYEDLGDHKKALKCLEAGKDFVERDPELISLMARIYASQNQNETARGKYMLLAELEAEAGRIDAALDAYMEILVLLPDEEDRLARRVEELKEGALAEVALRAKQKREELEQEEIRRQEEEAAKEAAGQEEEEKDERGEGGKGTQAKSKAVQPSAGGGAPQKQRDQVASRTLPQDSAPVERSTAPSSFAAQTDRSAMPDRKKGDAAYDLGMVYQRMGLSDEAAAEFAKARDVYNACVDGGLAEPDISDRLSRIDAALAGEISEGSKPAGEKRVPVSSDEKTASPEARPPQAEKGVAKPGEKKKKVSFV
ncbi:MAG TPA: tetratricopeptide repeat protein [bacterium]|nr:tetratricopeptide repeat protein [bacterium]